MIKEDCFAYIQVKSKCNALNGLYCASGNCSFYQTAKEAKEAIEKSNPRRVESGFVPRDPKRFIANT